MKSISFGACCACIAMIIYILFDSKNGDLFPVVCVAAIGIIFGLIFIGSKKESII